MLYIYLYNVKNKEKINEKNEEKNKSIVKSLRPIKLCTQ